VGLIVSLQETHDVQSNKESGHGRYDVMLIPKDRSQLGIVMEFKTVPDENASLAQAAEQALQQIIARGYAQTLQSKGIQKILHMGLAFHRKTVAVTSRGFS
jgi:PD-(D/E)XK nuclease superfamily